MAVSKINYIFVFLEFTCQLGEMASKHINKKCMPDGEAEMEAWGKGDLAGVQGHPSENEVADREEPCGCLENSHNILMDKMGTYGCIPVLLGLLQTNKDYSPAVLSDRDLREFLVLHSAALIRALHH